MEKISGTQISNTIIEELKIEADNLKAKNILPTLAVILVGNDPASAIYVNNKKKACQKVGIISLEKTLPEQISENKLLNIIDELNNDQSVHGILCQLPLPPHINEKKIIERIDPKKDVDGINPINIGRLCYGSPLYYPCTPFGIVQLLKRSNIEISGKHVVIVGRGPTIGRPLSIILSSKGFDSTVTVCHSKSTSIQTITKTADILVAAIGKAKFITKDFIKEGVVIVDVGINRIPDENSPSKSKVVGDVDFEDVFPKVRAITPVPGGVGPMTVAMLMHNTILAAKQ
ncbi:MAG: bifunctional methylenetetrahydrofolate dehydrogenase/methenyltetrahydrofolate cyclohydrolase FolD [Oligoflexia bacterium]|nr:bifunctional methylenetetrahydrofolate dehydrogenase/methenyltetrahydrofolate cyclohydrolase FolD [Oligoflexia bacterium]